MYNVHRCYYCRGTYTAKQHEQDRPANRRRLTNNDGRGATRSLTNSAILLRIAVVVLHHAFHLRMINLAGRSTIGSLSRNLVFIFVIENVILSSRRRSL